jgi:hypothetical protein
MDLMGVYFMVNCCIHEDIYKGQIDKKKYRIWTVMGRESTLSYWYVVMSDETYEKEYNHENVDLESIDDKITDQAIDIRKLSNYIPLSNSEILFNRKQTIIPIIREALKAGYVKVI